MTKPEPGSSIEDFLARRRSQAEGIIDDAQSLRELGVSDDEIPSFLMQSLGRKHKITPDNIPDELVEDAYLINDSGLGDD